MNRVQIKNGVKRSLLSHPKAYLKATLIIPGLLLVSALGDKANLAATILAFFTVTVGFLGRDLYRSMVFPENLTLKNNFYKLKDGSDTMDIILLNLLILFYTTMWSLLLIVPGIIKGLSYSQSVYIYFDEKEKGNKITYNEAITRSRSMMNGNKVDYFVFRLSFLGWYILAGIVASLIAALLSSIGLGSADTITSIITAFVLWPALTYYYLAEGAVYEEFKVQSYTI